jgi:ketosteroid isomerase-like protein
MLDKPAVEAFLANVHALRVAGDVEGLVALFDDEATFRIVGSAANWPFTEAAVGKDAIRTALRGLVDTFSFLEYRVERALIDGDDVSVHCALKVRHNPSGRIANTEVSDLMTFKNGRCLSYTQFADTALAIELSGG